MKNTIYQVATLQSLMMGNYYGFVSYDEMLKLGDTGIGTFEGLDGEMITLDGTVYKAKADGTIEKPDTSVLTPYCVMTKFVPDRSVEIENCPDYESLCRILDGAVPAKERNHFHAAKIIGEFSAVLTRSVVGCEPPYEITDRVVDSTQIRLSMENVRGTAIAVRCPDYMDRLNMPGWHLHFITEDRTRGGHVINLTAVKAKAEMSVISRFEMVLPDSEVFGSLHLLNVSNNAVEKLEKK